MLEREWWRGAVLYQVYPASFYDSNGDGWGDLPGLLRKLDYVHRLGVDGFWLQSIVPSAMDDHGYDVTEHCDVNPRFGSLEDFDALVAKCRRLGLRLVLEQVYGHTSNRHPWFIESRRGRDSATADWYVWADPKPDGTEPTNWRAVDCGPTWTWDHSRGQYFMHHWLKSMPHLDHNVPAVREAIAAVARFWLDRGVDGFRLDVVNTLVVDALLRDNPPTGAPAMNPMWAQRMVYDASRPENLDAVRALRRVADAYDSRFLLGEMYGERLLEDAIEYCAAPDLLHSAYFILGETFEHDPTAPHRLASELVAELGRWDHARAWPTWTFGSHDAARVRTRLGGPTAPVEFAECLMALLLCLRGTVMFPQGEELGLPLGAVPYHARRDPLARAAYPAAHDRDCTRTPMPWEWGAPHAGFTLGTPWLPVDPRHEALAVNAQEANPRSMLHWTRQWIALRRREPALVVGSMRLLEAPPGVVAFERELGNDRLVGAFNLAASTADVSLPATRELLAASSGVAIERDSVRLPPYAAALVRLAPTAGTR